MSKKDNQLITPKGIARFVAVQSPSFKFDKDGRYVLILAVPDAEAVNLRKELEALADKGYSQMCDEQGKKRLKRAELPLSQEVNEETGEPTGYTLINLSQRAVITPKDGEPYEVTVACFTAKRNPIPKTTQWGSGSKVRAKFEVAPYFSAGAGAGITLRLKAVQVIDLVPPTRCANADGFDEEDGYDNEPEPDDNGSAAEGKAAGDF